MKRAIIVTLAFAAFASLAWRSYAIAGDGCCSQCGCQCECSKICRLVCEEKKVEVICWGCQCDDFCVPGPSCPGCQHCDEACIPTPGDQQKKNLCAGPQRFLWTEWGPSESAKVYTKKKLMKKVEIRKVPAYKWVVQDLCPNCAANPQPAPPAGAPLPPAPKSAIALPPRG